MAAWDPFVSLSAMRDANSGVLDRQRQQAQDRLQAVGQQAQRGVDALGLEATPTAVGFGQAGQGRMAGGSTQASWYYPRSMGAIPSGTPSARETYNGPENASQVGGYSDALKNIQAFQNYGRDEAQLTGTE